MAPRKAFPLRIDATVHAAVERWAADELRSVNAQIEFLLRDALRRAGRLGPAADGPHGEEGEGGGGRSVN